MALIRFFDFLLQQESLTPIVLVLRLESNEAPEYGLKPLLDELYRLSWDRHVFFPFSRSQLPEIENILDPIVARMGSAPYGISYLLDQPPWRVLAEALIRWESCALITDREAEDLPVAAVHFGEAKLAGAQTLQWYHVRGRSDPGDRLVGGLALASTARAMRSLLQKPQEQRSRLLSPATP